MDEGYRIGILASYDRHFMRIHKNLLQQCSTLGTFSKASLVGANTVKGPSPDNTSANPRQIERLISR